MNWLVPAPTTAGWAPQGCRMASSDSQVASRQRPAAAPASDPSVPAADDAPRRVRLPEWALAVGVLAAAIALTVAINLWWIAVHRSGLPYDVDESGYLLRAVHDSDALHTGGLVELARTIHTPDRSAPLVPFVAGMVRYVSGAGATALIGVVQLFAVVLAGATYVVSRRLATRPWAVLCAVVVMTVPGVLLRGRQFDFALPAAAMLMAALAAQLSVADFTSLPRSLLWGGLLGLTALTRTMILPMIGALVVAAVVRLIVIRGGRRQMMVAGGGLIFGFLVAWSWYSASWRAVASYLYSDGYGASAGTFGSGRSFWSASWWTFRLTRAVNTEVFLPLTAALVLCIAFLIVAAIRRRVNPAGTRPGGAHQGAHSWLGSDTATVVILLVVGYLALSSTGNAGSGFELVLIPPAVVLIVCAVSRVGQPARSVAAVACGMAAVFSLVAQSGFLPGASSTIRSAHVGPVNAVVLNSEGGLYLTAKTVFGCWPVVRCKDVAPGTTDKEYLERWETAADRFAVLVHRASSVRGRQPVVDFAVEDPFFNANSVGLAYEIEYHSTLGEGVLRLVPRGASSLSAQLRAAAGPNLVVTGRSSKVPAAFAISPISDWRRAKRAVAAAGYSRIGHLTLPDGRRMYLWWKAKGPVVPRGT